MTIDSYEECVEISKEHEPFATKWVDFAVAKTQEDDLCWDYVFCLAIVLARVDQAAQSANAEIDQRIARNEAARNAAEARNRVMPEVLSLILSMVTLVLSSFGMWTIWTFLMESLLNQTGK